MSLFLNDVRYAARVLLKSRGFTVVALLTLALAIGANTAIFSVINAVLLRPLPFRAPDQLVQVQRGFPGGEGGPTVNVPEFLHVQRNSRSFSGVTTYDTLGSGFNLTGDSAPERIVGSRVSQQFFSVFGVRPQLGRDFRGEEDRPGGAKVVILSDGLWRRRFGADPALVGKALNLNGEPYTVIGVTPPGFRYPATAELWTPVGIDPDSQERANYLEITGRLKDGLSFAKAQAEMAVLADQFRKANPERMNMNEKETIRLKPLQVRLYGQMRPALLVLLGAVGCVLLIACVNVANLQLARATARKREMAIRAALGARSSRIFAQLLTESVLLALAGGVLGLFLGWATIKPLLALIPGGQVGQIIRASLPPIRIDGMVLLFTFGVSLAAGVLFGLAPALQAVRVNLHEPLKEGTSKSTGGRKGRIARRFLVMSEVALALVLITGAALLLKSFAGLTDREPGFRPDHVLTLKVSLPESRYGKPEALDQFGRQLTERLRALPAPACSIRCWRCGGIEPRRERGQRDWGKRGKPEACGAHASGGKLRLDGRRSEERVVFHGVAGPVVRDLRLQELVDRAEGLRIGGGDHHLAAVLRLFIAPGDGALARDHLRHARQHAVVDGLRSREVAGAELPGDFGEVAADLVAACAVRGIVRRHLDGAAGLGDQEMMGGALVVEAHVGIAALVELLILHVLLVHGAVGRVHRGCLGACWSRKRTEQQEGQGLDDRDSHHELSSVTGSGAETRDSSNPGRAPGPARGVCPSRHPP